MLLTATERHEILVTHNRHDFVQLHRAWLLWPPAFDLAFPTHPGILVLDQRPLAEQDEQRVALHTLLSQLPTADFANQIFWWHGVGGWRRLDGGHWARHKEYERPPFPRRLRVKRVRGEPGVWELTWEWPDGRLSTVSRENRTVRTLSGSGWVRTGY